MAAFALGAAANSTVRNLSRHLTLAVDEAGTEIAAADPVPAVQRDD